MAGGNTRPSRVVLFGEVGAGNLGNDGSFAAALQMVREVAPDADITCVCRGPERVAEWFGLPARSLVFRRVANPRHPRTYAVLVRAPGKLLDLLWTIRLLLGRDMVIVPGAGVLESSAARPWRLPWALWCLGLSARLTRTELVYLAVGADRADNVVTRRLLAGAVRRAAYRSFRDAPSRDAVASLGIDTSQDPVRPDLAFSATPPDDPAPPTAAVGLGVISFVDWRGDPATVDQRRRRYVDRMADLAEGLLDDGASVHLVAGDRSDFAYVDDVRAEVLRRRPDADVVPVQVERTDDFVAALRRLDVVIGARYHNVVYALALAKPTIGLCYAPKTAALMRAFGAGDLCHDAVDFEPAAVRAQAGLLRSVAVEVGAQHRATLHDVYLEVDRQRAELAGVLAHGRARTTRYTPPTQPSGRRRHGRGKETSETAQPA